MTFARAGTLPHQTTKSIKNYVLLQYRLFAVDEQIFLELQNDSFIFLVYST